MRLVLFGLFVLSACSGGGLITETAPPPTSSVDPVSTTAAASASATPEPPSEPAAAPISTEVVDLCTDPFDGLTIAFPIRFWRSTDFCIHSVDYSEIFSGGQPPDGIPAIDKPKFETVESADEWLEDAWPVMIFEAEGDVRGYPLAVLIWHEIVNDEVGGQMVTLTFCPLCNSTIAFDRVLDDGTVLDFGTTGNLRNSDLIMYDRQTRSWWQQFTGEAIVGELTGTMLEMLPSQIISWADFKANYPDAPVLSRDTGHQRRYGNNPYGGYDDIGGSPFFPVGAYGDQLPPVERVVAVTVGDTDFAFPFSLLAEAGVANVEIEGQPVVVFWKAGTSTTFGNSGTDVGSSGVFSRELNGEILTFEPTLGDFRDLETGSRWTISGEAIGGDLAGSQLDRLVSGEHFWFAWSVFKPETVVWQP